MSMSASVPHPRRQALADNRAADPRYQPDYTLVGDTLIIASVSTLGRLYTVTETGCTCKAGQNGFPCKHQSKRRMVLLPAPARCPMSDTEYAAVLAACDELC